ncbi:MAG: hypothetical protein AAF371_07185 [Pseudomonadota bacterium]
MNETFQMQYRPYFERAHKLRAEETRRIGRVIWNGLRAVAHRLAALYQTPSRRRAGA